MLNQLSTKFKFNYSFCLNLTPFGKVVSLILILLSQSITYGQGLKASGKKIVDSQGNEIILRGMGLGGWMIQEGYMMETSNFAGPQHEIKAKIEDLIGSANTAEYYKRWHLNHCTERDIDSLASWGFNSVRLPMHYNLFTLPIEQEPVADSNTWLEEGFALTDSLIKWCSARHMYVILDLHGAPGGQGRDANISDYDPPKPSLWESQANKNKTIALWRKLAQRYVNEPWVGGYDLINEPNWNFTAGGNQNGCSENGNAPLRELLINITNAIREIDQNHIIIIEGNCWGNNYNGLMPPWDPNMVASYHKYWSYNDAGSISGMINLRNTYNMPVWLGESGENSNQWFTAAIRLLENNKIGWAWWPLKKLSSVVNPMTIQKNSDYQTLLNYWQNGGTKPTAEFATNAMFQLAENAKIENCIFRKDIIDAMFRQVYDKTSAPFAKNEIPGTIPAAYFDLGENNIAYYDTDIADYHVSSGTYTSWNNGWAFRNDGVDIEQAFDADQGGKGFDIGWTADNEWMKYTTTVDSTAAYTLKVRYASSGTTASLRFLLNDIDIAAPVSLPSTGGTQQWKSISVNDVILPKGIQPIKLFWEKGGANLGYFSFELSGSSTGIAFKPLFAETVGETEVIQFTFNKSVAASVENISGLQCKVNGVIVPITNIIIKSVSPLQLSITLNKSIIDSDVITLDYSGTQLVSTDASLLGAFSDFPVKNNLPRHISIPGKFEAEAFVFNSGLQLETTTDVGGGQDLGYTNAGDFLDFLVRVEKTATYKIEARVACNSSAGILEFLQLSNNGSLLGTSRLDVPVTGGWQSWTSAYGEMQLTEGLGTLRIKVIQPEFNMNWFKFTEIVEDTSSQGLNNIRIYPNPVGRNQQLRVEVPEAMGKTKNLSIRSLNGSLMAESSLNADAEAEWVNLGHIEPGLYIVELQTEVTRWHTKLLIL